MKSYFNIKCHYSSNDKLDKYFLLNFDSQKICFIKLYIHFFGTEKLNLSPLN